MVRIAADQRREQARLAARRVLRDGTPVTDLTLRKVAEAAGTPLPSLTYVYPAVGALLGDLRSEFELQVAQRQADVGGGGLRVELRDMIAKYLELIGDDRANVEILRYQILQVGSGAIVIPGGLTMAGCLRRIQAASGEQWAVPIDELALLTQAMMSGMHIQFFVRGADEVALQAWRQDSEVIVDAVCALAKPA